MKILATVAIPPGSGAIPPRAARGTAGTGRPGNPAGPIAASSRRRSSSARPGRQPAPRQTEAGSSRPLEPRAGQPGAGRCTLTCGHVVKFAVAPGGGHGRLRPPGVQRFGVGRVRGPGSRAAAVGAVLVPPGDPAPERAGKQHGLACHPGPAISSAGSARHVKPMAVAGSRPSRPRRPRLPQAAGRRGWPSGGLAAVRPGHAVRRRARPARGNGAGDGAASRRGRALRRSGGAPSPAR